MGRVYRFTSESVSEGHPDKLCDQISDAVLDECLFLDRDARVACECFATTNFVVVGGEITSTKTPNIVDVAKNVIKEVGYDSELKGMDYKTVKILNTVHEQSRDIAIGINGENSGIDTYNPDGLLGAGDQGIMFGYACLDTENYMPAPITFANMILENAAKFRKNDAIHWLRPDAKSQVTVEYENNKPIRITDIVVSHQHDDHIKHSTIRNTIIEEIIKPLFKNTDYLTNKTNYFINPTGRFVKGGPDGDTGLTGRKIIVDTYGGMGRHGGGAFSGKDPTKVDRSGAYMARHIAKTVVASGMAARCEVQLSYAIGIPHPISVYINTFNELDVYDEEKISKAIMTTFDMSPGGIINKFNLCTPIYKKTASYGHFSNKDYPWEKLDVETFLSKLKKYY